MTKKINGVLVTFEHEIKENDAKQRCDAILQIKGVIAVNHIPEEGLMLGRLAYNQARRDLEKKIWEALDKD